MKKWQEPVAKSCGNQSHQHEKGSHQHHKEEISIPTMRKVLLPHALRRGERVQKRDCPVCGMDLVKAPDLIHGNNVHLSHAS
jgi:Cu2+-exporting ATPase